MKRFLSLLAAAALAVFSAGIITAFAYSGSVDINGDQQVYPGSKHTYTITVSAQDAGTVLADITCSGIFIKESGDSMIEWSEAANSSGVIYTGSFTVRVSSAAKPGETGTITVSGSAVSYIDDKYNTDEKDFSGTFIAEVAESGQVYDPSEWDAVLKSVQSMPAGGALILDLSNTEIPAEVLSALKEQQGTLTLNAGGGFCVIDGKSLAGIPGSIVDTDVAVSMKKEKALSAAANGQDVYQLNFAREGQLPGRFRFSFAAAKSRPGDILYLYRYYSASGVLEGAGASVVDAEGFAAFDIYCRSGYVVSNSVLEGSAGSPASLGALAEQLQSQVKSRNAENEDLKARLEGANDTAALQAERYEGMLSLSPAVFIAAIAGALLLSAILTMLVFRAGIFAPRKAKASGNAAGVREYRSGQ
jgi:hypothetical protein